MPKKLSITIDEELLLYTANYFGYRESINYSQLIEQALFYFLKPQKKQETRAAILDKKIENVLVEPVFDIDLIEQNYNLDWSLVEGKWQGKEPVEELIQMLSK